MVNFEEARQAFIKLVDDLDKTYLADFFQWIQGAWLSADCLGEGPAIAYSKLRQIAEELREMVPVTGILPSEEGKQFSLGENADCDPKHTVHVDAFLYEDYELDELASKGKLASHYCKNCGSHNVAPLTYISHSASLRRIEFIYRALLPPIDGKTLLDVGSRLGGILYGAYVHTKAAKIIGVEMNKDLCDIQNKIIQKHGMRDRIQITCSNICDVPEIVSSADIVVLNNVFEFFLNKEQQEKCWKFLKDNIRKGVILVTIPSLEDSLKHLETGIDLAAWVKLKPITDPLTAITAKEQSELSDVLVYEVL